MFVLFFFIFCLEILYVYFFFFFFQAEDGIRDGTVTGVQTCALPIYEKMNGTGYPKRLTRAQMSPVARMMAIADVFEALTAADRPYKKAKTLSEAIRIMASMKRDHHLDPDLLDLFLSAGVWKSYAERFLDEAQIDEPDIDAVLRIQPA